MGDRLRFFLIAPVLALLFASCRAGPTDAALRSYAAATLRYEAGDFPAARKLLSSAAPFYSSLLLAGKIEYFDGDAAAAADRFSAALKKRSTSVEARLWLARSLLIQGNNKKAERLVESILADDPGDIGALRFAADRAVSAGDLGTAASLLDRAAVSGSEIALALLDRARLSWIGGNADAALSDLHAALVLLPDDGAPRKAAAALIRSIEEQR